MAPSAQMVERGHRWDGWRLEHIWHAGGCRVEVTLSAISKCSVGWCQSKINEWTNFEDGVGGGSPGTIATRFAILEKLLRGTDPQGLVRNGPRSVSVDERQRNIGVRKALFFFFFYFTFTTEFYHGVPTVLGRAPLMGRGARGGNLTLRSTTEYLWLRRHRGGPVRTAGAYTSYVNIWAGYLHARGLGWRLIPHAHRLACIQPRRCGAWQMPCQPAGCLALLGIGAASFRRKSANRG